MRIGVFGGAFDPPHSAHVALIAAAFEQLQLDALRVFPTGQAWHKPRALSPAPHRLAMAELAFGGMPGVAVDGREIRRSGPTYTIDTLRELQAEEPSATLALIIGEDQALALTQWHEWEAVLEAAIICIAGRVQAAGTEPQFDPSKLPQGRFLRLQLPAMPVSATEIRSRVASRLGIDPLVPGPVARYIAQHHLYQTA
ncbi:MAG TPA: nicotinate (nicotinamide) nucleotide adenylyltransferase [Burkholderiaceae bacterium]|nr:nicotinate (nicotinamide) nucleotide adenylyltransferase [Burkholderiaceae bacterium]